MSTTFIETLSDDVLAHVLKEATSPPSVEDLLRRQRHAIAEAKSAGARRDANRARRDDFARAAYYALLSGPAETEEARAGLRNMVLTWLEAAGYDRAAAEADMQEHMATGRADLTGWLRMRRRGRKQVEQLAALQAELHARQERRSAADRK